MDNLIGHDIKNIPRTADVWTDNNTTFKDMHFSGPILQGLEDNGFVKPSPIQLKALPLARCGFDLIVQSKSGTGKTLVFVLSTLEVIDVTCPRVQCIVLTPTREIAMQVADVFAAVGRQIKDLLVKTFIGGLPLSQDIVEAQQCHIAVGAPGRIRQLIELGHLKTEAVRLFILDEADQLMNTTFQPDINFIYWKQAETKQVLALSATYPPELVKFLSQYLRTGRHVTPSSDPLPILRGISQFVSITRRHPDATARLADKEKRLAVLLASTKFNQAIVFSNYQSRAESTCNMLRCEGWSASWISAGQKQESRIKTMEDFRSGQSRVLVSTDLTSRGIDSKTVDLVINLDSPWDPRVYLHRMGRAGRFGSQGIVITILSDSDVLPFRKMFGLIGGDSLYVCVIPPEGVEDLRSVDKTKLKHIYGISPEFPETNPETGEASANAAGKSKVKDTNGESTDCKETSVRANRSKTKPDFPSLTSSDSRPLDSTDLDDNKENKSHNPVRKKSYSDMVQGEKNEDDLGKTQQAEKRKRLYCDVLLSKKDRGYHFDDNVKETHFTGQKVKEVEKTNTEMSCQELNTYFMKSNPNNEPLSFSNLLSSKETFLGLKHSKTDRPNDKSDNSKIEFHEGCDIFEFKAIPTDCKLMTCPSVDESKAAKLLLEADEKSPKKKNIFKKKERKSSDRDVKETELADVLNHYLSESIKNEVHLAARCDEFQKKSDLQAHRGKRQAKKEMGDLKFTNEKIDENFDVTPKGTGASPRLAACPNEAHAAARHEDDSEKKSDSQATHRGDKQTKKEITEDSETSNEKVDSDFAFVLKAKRTAEQVLTRKFASIAAVEHSNKTGVPVPYGALCKCHDAYINSSSDLANHQWEPVATPVTEKGPSKKSPKGAKVPGAAPEAEAERPLCREDFLKHHVLTKKASTKRNPRFEGYLSDSSTSEGEYILSQSYLNSKAHHRQPRSHKKVPDPYQDWTSMYKYQLSTITNYVEFCDQFKYFP